VTFTLSPPVRYAALLGLLAALLMGGGMTVLSHSQSSTATPHVIKRPFGAGGVKKKATPALPQKRTAQATKPTVAKPKSTPSRPAAPKAQERLAVQAAIAAGLPNAVASALGRNRIVVVSIYNPYSEVDGIAFAEARAGAQVAGAGFVGLNVLSQAQVGKLTQMLGLLPDPGLLVYTRPGTLVARISGFADKETVAQAAQNAARGT
jgi:hypothetical protein